MKKFLVSGAALVVALFLAVSAQAEIRLSGGYFIALSNCEALQSIRKQTNPGNIRLTVDMAYEVLAKNKADATHYRVRVKGASTMERWVPVTCGTLLVDCRKVAADVPSGPTQPSSTSRPSSRLEYLLALSWQPAFCQTHQSKKECSNQTEDRYDASHFTLHGLWPQPRSNVYCNVSRNEKQLDEQKKWERLPRLTLRQNTYNDLTKTMSGVASFLHRHQWIKHGTCYSATPEEYFRESIMLADQVNTSAVRDFFAANIGKTVSAADIKAKFDAAFGAGAGDKVKIKCSNGMIAELWININGEIDEHTQLKDLLKNADHASSSCREGLIDPVGY